MNCYVCGLQIPLKSLISKTTFLRSYLIAITKTAIYWSYESFERSIGKSNGVSQIITESLTMDETQILCQMEGDLCDYL